MSYSGKVVLGDSVDKLLLQSQIDSFEQIMSSCWEPYSTFFNQVERRLKKTINDWISPIMGEWVLQKVTWPISVEIAKDDSIYVSGEECHGKHFLFVFTNPEYAFKISLKFKDYSLEQDLEAFHNLEFEQFIFEIRFAYLDQDVSFFEVTSMVRLHEFIDFLSKNFDHLKGLFQECVLESKQKCDQWNSESQMMLAKHHTHINQLKEFEVRTKIQQFLNACNRTVEFEIPQRLRLSFKKAVIAKSVKVLKVYTNHRQVDVEIEELDLGLKEKVRYSKKVYNKVLIKTLFEFDLTQSENLKLVSNDI